MIQNRRQKQALQIQKAKKKQKTKHVKYRNKISSFLYCLSILQCTNCWSPHFFSTHTDQEQPQRLFGVVAGRTSS